VAAVKPEVIRSRINTGPAAPRHVRRTTADVIRNPRKIEFRLYRSFSVFVNVVATNAA
jgi:hypothetical protein